MQKVVIIGSDSYIATGLDKYLTDCQVNKLYFHNWQQNIELLKQADCVINFSIAPEFSSRNIVPDEVLDIQIAKQLKNSATHYFFISSRKVYGSTDNLVIHKETDVLHGVDFYARNKIMTEQSLTDILGDNLAVLRVANIIGEPVDRSGYKTFIGWICESFLKNGKLVVTQNADAVKDFITKDFLQKSIDSLIQKHATGIYNVSSGFGTSVRDVLTGYVGAQNIDFQGQTLSQQDQFILNNEKLLKTTNGSISPLQIEQSLALFRQELQQMKDKSL